MLTANEIRRRFIQFFEERNHRFIPSAPVVPHGDETLMFTNAGMNQFKDIFLGHRQPEARRAVNSQKCIRVSGKHNDLEEVGLDTYHHTFFEMLGNWSFGDYFKAEAIEWAWTLLTTVFEIAPDRLWATVFAGDAEDGSEADEEAARLWTDVTSLPADRVLRCGKKDNFWEMGTTGPCGPCSEIHIDLGLEHCDRRDVTGHRCRVNGDCARFIELWNLVFIQFNRQADGTLVPLGANHIDTGAGLERLCAVLQNRHSNYDTDLFMPIIRRLEELTGHRYRSELGNPTDNAFRVIADHIRSLTFAITDGVVPSNEGRGYVIRRILRRAARFGRVLQANEPFLFRLVPVLAESMGEAFPELPQRAEFVQQVIEAEEAGFGRTLDRGLEIFADAAERAQTQGRGVLSGADAFQLYDTYGFPLDLTQLLARERGLTVDEAGFDRLMEQQRQRARAGAKTSQALADLTGVELPRTDDSAKYTDTAVMAKVLGWIDRSGLVTEGLFDQVDTEIGLILEKTCFYAEAGGQVGDQGLIKTCDFEFEVTQTEKIADCVVHRGRLRHGSIEAGELVKAVVSRRRAASQKNHTATHLLQWALQEVLGKDVHQQGSLVCPEYLRFDFTYPKALTTEQLAQVETRVNEKIQAAEPVTCVTMDIEQAKAVGAMALFGEKYGQQVRVVAIGADRPENIKAAFSREFCGGTHVDNTEQLWGFVITKEESVAAGVRRITALTGPAMVATLGDHHRIVDQLGRLLKVPAEQLVGRVEKLLDDQKKLAKQLKAAAKQGGTDALAQARDLLDQATRIGSAAVVVGRLHDTDIEQGRAAIDLLKKKAGSVVAVLGLAGDGKVTLLAGVSDDLVAQGLKAGDIVKTIAPIVGGGGGGRPQLAQAGGKDPEKLDDALTQARRWIAERLAS